MPFFFTHTHYTNTPDISDFTRFNDLQRPYLIPTYLIPTLTIKMRSFAVIAAISAIGAQAMPDYYPVAESSSTPVYEATTPAYAASTPVYKTSSAYEAYPVSSSTKYPAYAVESSSAKYEASTPVAEKPSSKPVTPHQRHCSPLLCSSGNCHWCPHHHQALYS
ncbi:uncharacterized protein M421DRAFT_313558 [Didymella exigua CBS 183.55]|uniref:Uncharacterized protein n=1 Tax=Didymella exigua CBS 183.55 TaxID=1150837 RepID=A0A6A5RWD2_9PLEO|nr:uncharacterized protein M421DRAFT_313558 [Didymella exigua CBS 183.55]KAF1931494.1 hypothetical protein M421DRAFT_313558 [Didymella exigua CBS 183.55]